MNLPQVVLLLGYASLVLELWVFAVPSVASTWQQMHGRPSRRWALVHLLPAALAVTAFAWPGVLVIASFWAPAAAPWAPAWSSWPGACLVVLGRAGTLAALPALRRCRSPFTTAGPYRLCRNPALLGLHVFLLGGIAILPAWHTALAWLLFVLHMHRRVRSEERHLAATGGNAYAHYCARVRRYLPAGTRRVPR